MDTINRVYFPLRSNAGWFQRDDLHSAIENLFKLAILVYDEIVLEDGTFIVDMTDRGGSSMWLPPGEIPDDERIVIAERDLCPTELTLAVGREDQPGPLTGVLRGNTVFRAKIDYFEFVRSIDLARASFLKLCSIGEHDLATDVRQSLTRSAWRDEHAVRDLVPNTHLRSTLIKGLNQDIYVSAMIGAALVLDPSQQNLLERKIAAHPAAHVLTHSPETLGAKHIIDIAVPDLSQLTIIDTVDLRQSRPWSAFRQFVRGLLAEIEVCPALAADYDALCEVVRRRVDEALLSELLARNTGTATVALDMLLGGLSFVAVPAVAIGSSALSALKTIAQLFQQRGSWVAFLQHLKTKATPHPEGRPK